MRRLVMWLVVLGVSLSLATGCCSMGGKKDEMKPSTSMPAPPAKK